MGVAILQGAGVVHIVVLQIFIFYLKPLTQSIFLTQDIASSLFTSSEIGYYSCHDSSLAQAHDLRDSARSNLNGARACLDLNWKIPHLSFRSRDMRWLGLVRVVAGAVFGLRSWGL
jgi:hypothetical protein